MGVEHLVGKRTGRPKGSKTTAPWRRDLLWAYRNLGQPDAVAPSVLAAGLAALGREHPERLAALLLRMERAGGRGTAPAARVGSPPVRGAAPKTSAAGPPPPREAGWPGRRLKRLTVPLSKLADLYATRRPDDWWAAVLPRAFELVDSCLSEVDGQEQVTLTFSSPEFPPLAEGEPIPELTAELSR